VAVFPAMTPTLRSSISTILGSCRPAAVSEFVVPIDVYSVEVHSRRTFSHVCEEVYKNEPSFANGDSSTAVAFPTSAFRIAASSKHVGPSSIGAGSFADFVVAMFARSYSGAISFPASAASSMAGSQGMASDDGFCSAVTKTSPTRSAEIFYGDESPKALTSEILEGRHRDLSIWSHMVSHARVVFSFFFSKWWITHIGEEIFKNIPTFDNWRIATLMHLDPSRESLPFRRRGWAFVFDVFGISWIARATISMRSATRRGKSGRRAGVEHQMATADAETNGIFWDRFGFGHRCSPYERLCQETAPASNTGAVSL